MHNIPLGVFGVICYIVYRLISTKNVNEKKQNKSKRHTRKKRRKKNEINFCDAFQLTQYLGRLNKMESYACASAFVFNISLSLLFQFDSIQLCG